MVGAGRVLNSIRPVRFILQRGLLPTSCRLRPFNFHAHGRDVGAVARIVAAKGFAADRDLKRGRSVPAAASDRYF